MDDLINAGLSLSAASKYLAKKNNLTKSIIYNLYLNLINKLKFKCYFQLKKIIFLQLLSIHVYFYFNYWDTK